MRILISGASVAGPVLTYWLSRYGFDVTVVERAPTLRKTDGHAVDLFRPAMEISAKMGVLPRIEALATGTTRLTLYREGAVLGAYVRWPENSPGPTATACARSPPTNCRCVNRCLAAAPSPAVPRKASSPALEPGYGR